LTPNYDDRGVDRFTLAVPGPPRPPIGQRDLAQNLPLLEDGPMLVVKIIRRSPVDFDHSDGASINRDFRRAPPICISRPCNVDRSAMCRRDDPRAYAPLADP
jgi:hypothetical protein